MKELEIISQIPILEIIFDYLDYNSRQQLHIVCKPINEIIYKNLFLLTQLCENKISKFNILVGNIKLFEYYKNNYNIPWDIVIDKSCYYNNLELIEWCYTKKLIEFQPMHMNNAAKYGHLDIIKYYHENNHICTEDAMDFAAEYGHLKIVKYLYENRKEGCTRNAMNHAMNNRHYDVTLFLYIYKNNESTIDIKEYIIIMIYFYIMKFVQ